MPTLLQINVTANWGSTGRISESCNDFAYDNGFNVISIFGRHKSLSKYKQI